MYRSDQLEIRGVYLYSWSSEVYRVSVSYIGDRINAHTEKVKNIRHRLFKWFAVIVGFVTFFLVCILRRLNLSYHIKLDRRRIS